MRTRIKNSISGVFDYTFTTDKRERCSCEDILFNIQDNYSRLKLLVPAISNFHKENIASSLIKNYAKHVHATKRNIIIISRYTFNNKSTSL